MKERSVRRRRTREEIEALVAEFRGAGVSREEFARAQQVHPVTVSGWVRQCTWARSKRRQKGGDLDPQFVAVKIRPSETVLPLSWPEIVSPSGWRIRIPPESDPGSIRPLLTLLNPC